MFTSRKRIRRKNKNQLVLDFSARAWRPQRSETFEDALEQTFPERALTEQELFEYFCRLFPAEAE